MAKRKQQYDYNAIPDAEYFLRMRYNAPDNANVFGVGGGAGTFVETTQEANPELYQQQVDTQNQNKFLNSMSENSSAMAGVMGGINNAITVLQDPNSSNAQKVFGALGIGADAKIWEGDTSKVDNAIKDAQAQMQIGKNNLIQDASSVSGAMNGLKANSLMPRQRINFTPTYYNDWKELKGGKGGFWKNMGTATLQGAANGSIGGPWGAAGGAVAGILGSVAGLFGRKSRYKKAMKAANERMNYMVNAARGFNMEQDFAEKAANQNLISNGINTQRTLDMANFRAYGGNLFDSGGSVIDPDPPSSQITADMIKAAHQDAYYPDRLVDTYPEWLPLIGGDRIGELSENSAWWERILPYAGTAIDWDAALADPNWKNITSAGVSTALDFLPILRALKGLYTGAKTAFATSKGAGIGINLSRESKAAKRAAIDSYEKAEKNLLLDEINKKLDIGNSARQRAVDRYYDVVQSTNKANTPIGGVVRGSTTAAENAGKTYLRNLVTTDLLGGIATEGVQSGMDYAAEKGDFSYMDIRDLIPGMDYTSNTILSNNGVHFTYNPSSRTWVSEESQNGKRIVVPAEEMEQNLQKGLGKIIEGDTRAYGGGIDLSPNMMAMQQEKQDNDRLKALNQPFSLGLGNSFNQKMNMFPIGGTINEGNEEEEQVPVYNGGELPEITVSAESMPWYEKVWRKFNRNILAYPKYAYNYFFPDKNKFIVLDDDTEVNRITDENSAFGNDYILSNEFVEKENPNTIKTAKDFQYPNQDTLLGDKNIPLGNISTYYGIENGKLKAGKASDFEDDTFIVPNRTKNVGKIKEIQLPVEGEYDWGMPWSNKRAKYKELRQEGTDLRKKFVSQKKYETELRKAFDKIYGQNNTTVEMAGELAARDLIRNHQKEFDEYMTDWNNRRKEFMKTIVITKPRQGYVITENNDTLPIPNFNATPKMYFADENGNAAFVAGLKPNIEKVNDFLSEHPSYPIMIDNGRFKHITEGDDINAYTGGFMNPEDNYIIGIKQKAYGGKIDSTDYALAVTKEALDAERAKAKRNTQTVINMLYGDRHGEADNGNRYDFGGTMKNLPSEMQSYETGGTHEQNPYGGIQIGTDQQGNPNLVEQGEFRYGDYIFSDRIPVDYDTLFDFGLIASVPKKKPKKGQEKTYADYAKDLVNKTGDPNDPITKRTNDANLQRLANAEEYQKAAEQGQLALDNSLNEYKSALKNGQSPMYGSMKYNGMNGGADQMDASSLTNVSRSGTPMMAAYGGNLFAAGGRPYNPFTINDPLAINRYKITPTIDNPVPIVNRGILDDYTDNTQAFNRIDNNPEWTENDPWQAYNELNKYYDPYEIAALRQSYGMQPQGGVDEAFVKALQTDLKNKGYYKGSIDGDFGPQSRAALDAMNGTNAWTPYKANTQVPTNTQFNGALAKYNSYSTSNSSSTSNGRFAGNDAAQTAVEGMTNVHTTDPNSPQAPVENTGTIPPQTGQMADATKWQFKKLPTQGKWATVGLNAIQAGADANGFTNPDFNPNFNDANRLERKGEASTFARTNAHIGGYQAPDITDIQSPLAQAAQQQQATNRALQNIGGGRNAAASIIANDYNAGQTMGDIVTKVNAQNAANRMAAAEINRGIDQFNAQSDNDMYKDNLNAQINGQQMNLNATQASNEERLRQMLYQDATNRQAHQNIVTNQNQMYNNVLNMIADQAARNEEWNLINSKHNQDFYFDPKTGGWEYKGDSGAYSKLNNALATIYPDMPMTGLSADVQKEWNNLLQSKGGQNITDDEIRWIVDMERNAQIEQKAKREHELKLAELNRANTAKANGGYISNKKKSRYTNYDYNAI